LNGAKNNERHAPGPRSSTRVYKATGNAKVLVTFAGKTVATADVLAALKDAVSQVEAELAGSSGFD
jgi:hypothetical protein